jgi:Starch binding domain
VFSSIKNNILILSDETKASLILKAEKFVIDQEIELARLLKQTRQISIRYFTQSHHYLAISGECSLLGEWDPKKAKRMLLKSEGLWETTLEGVEGEFKFLVLTEDRIVVRWENGKNRCFYHKNFNVEYFWQQ